jgi:hypothetical protein
MTQICESPRKGNSNNKIKQGNAEFRSEYAEENNEKAIIEGKKENAESSHSPNLSKSSSSSRYAQFFQNSRKIAANQLQHWKRPHSPSI